MELDELEAAWATQGARLDRCIVVQEALLRERTARRMRFTLAPFVLLRALEVAIGGAALLLIAPVVAAHAGEPRYLVVGGATLLFALLATAQCLGLLIGSLRLAADGPVVEQQLALARLRRAEFRCLRFVLLGGAVAWLPLPVLLLEALSGAPLLARLDLGWLAANVGFGLLALLLGTFVSRRYLERDDLSPFAAKLVDALTDRALRRADAHLAELTEFHREEPRAN